MPAQIKEATDALRDIAEGISSRDPYDWATLAVTCMAAIATFAAVVVALKTSKEARTISQKSLEVAREAAVASASSAKVAMDMLVLETRRQDEKYWDDIRGPLRDLIKAHRDYDSVRTLGRSRFDDWRDYEKARDEQANAMLKALDVLIMTAKRADRGPAMSLVGLIREVRRTQSLDGLQSLAVGMEAFSGWADGDPPDLVSQQIDEYATQLTAHQHWYPSTP